MKTFTDATGRAWSLGLTLGTAAAVRDRLGVDLLQPEQGDPPLLTRLGTDEILLGEVMCVMLERQFETHQVTADDVRDSFDGRTLLDAQTAFYEDLADFFQSRGRTDRTTAVRKQMEMIRAGVTAVQQKIDAVDVDATIRGAMSGELPEASASTPDR